MDRLAPLFADVDFDAHNLFRSTDMDLSRAVVGRVFSPHTLRPLRPRSVLHAFMDHVPIGRMSLNRLAWGTEIDVDPGHLGDYYLLTIPQAGAARFFLDGAPTDVHAGRAGIVNPAQRFAFRADAAFEQVVLRWERSAVERQWEALSGRPLKLPLNFDCGLAMDEAAWSALRPLLALLGSAAMKPEVPSEGWQRRIEELLLSELLLLQPHTAGAALPSARHAQPPRVVARAQAYMGERLGEAVTVSDVALHCGVAVRTLQAAFANAAGCGPMAWLRQRRLEAAHAALREADPALHCVTELALAHGFTQLSDFTRAYRQRYGTTPSQTLRGR